MRSVSLYESPVLFKPIKRPEMAPSTSGTCNPPFAGGTGWCGCCNCCPPAYCQFAAFTFSLCTGGAGGTVTITLSTNACGFQCSGSSVSLVGNGTIYSSFTDPGLSCSSLVTTSCCANQLPAVVNLTLSGFSGPCAGLNGSYSLTWNSTISAWEAGNIYLFCPSFLLQIGPLGGYMALDLSGTCNPLDVGGFFPWFLNGPNGYCGRNFSDYGSATVTGTGGGGGTNCGKMHVFVNGSESQWIGTDGSAVTVTVSFDNSDCVATLTSVSCYGGSQCSMGMAQFLKRVGNTIKIDRAGLLRRLRPRKSCNCREPKVL